MREDCPNYRCKDCKYKGTYPNYCQHRVDHTNIEKAVPWFVSSPEESGIPCCDFEPSSIHVWDLKNYWIDWEHWWKDYLETWFPYYPKEKPEDKLVWFTLHGDKDIEYGVPMMDYIYGTMYDGDILKAVKKRYYVRHNVNDGSFPYELKYEDINGVKYK